MPRGTNYILSNMLDMQETRSSIPFLNRGRGYSNGRNGTNGRTTSIGAVGFGY